MKWNYHWRASPAVEELERNIDELRTTVIRLRREIKNKQGYVGRLKFLVRQRSDTIDLRGKLEQSQAQIGSSAKKPIISPSWSGCRETAMHITVRGSRMGPSIRDMPKDGAWGPSNS